MNDPTGKPYRVIDFDQLPGTPCPCGTARRALTEVADFPCTIHRTQITADAKLHYHRHLTEVYYFLQCSPDARMELDGELLPIKPGTCVYIPPGVSHRALGPMTVLIVVYPKFDPNDEVVLP
jgi:mannose-6-phosphate isomerase-like protein (cupin superfamily)